MPLCSNNVNNDVLTKLTGFGLNPFILFCVLYSTIIQKSTLTGNKLPAANQYYITQYLNCPDL